MSNIPTQESDEVQLPVEVQLIVPRVFRVMKRDALSGLPLVGASNSALLGVRPGADCTIDEAGNVVLDGSGMSVAPEWRMLRPARIPKRLRLIVPGAAGSDNTSCFTLGTGSFERGPVSGELELIPDTDLIDVIHGVIAPAECVSLEQFQLDLAKTQPHWTIDER